MNRRMDKSILWITLGVVAVLGVIATVSVLYFSSERIVTNCTIDSKERYTEVSGGGEDPVTSKQKKILYTSCGVFTVDDNLFFGKFNSADTYGSLAEGETFDLQVVGWRNGFLSWFPNVLSATPST